MSNPNSVLVIEDAEELIVSRDSQQNSNLAMILNHTDGILIDKEMILVEIYKLAKRNSIRAPEWKVVGFRTVIV